MRVYCVSSVSGHPSGELFEYQNSFRTQFPEYCGAANELFRFLHSLVRIHGGAREKLKVVASEL